MGDAIAPRLAPNSAKLDPATTTPSGLLLHPDDAANDWRHRLVAGAEGDLELASELHFALEDDADTPAAHVQSPALEDLAGLGLERHAGAHLVTSAASARRVNVFPGIRASTARGRGEAAAVLRVGQAR